jgi:hypothetical protein
MYRGGALELPMFFRRKVSNGHTYVQIVDNQRQGGESRQRVITTLGRLESPAGERSAGAFAGVGRTLRRQSDDRNGGRGKQHR